MLRGIKIQEGILGCTQKPRLPVTPKVLLTIHNVPSQRPTDFNNIMLWATFLTCFFGFLRPGDITIPSNTSYDPSLHLNFSDITLNSHTSPSLVRISLKCSKTDPFRQGVKIHIGRTDQTLCPLTAILNYVAIRGSSPGLLFHFRDKTPLTKGGFVSSFRGLLQQAGVDFRIGAASTAAARGVEDSLIQTLGRWKSSAYLAYVRIPPEHLASISNIIAHPNISIQSISFYHVCMCYATTMCSPKLNLKGDCLLGVGLRPWRVPGDFAPVRPPGGVGLTHPSAGT